jgi:DNA polymerase III alpha subunit (gram-positive type)
MKNLIKQIILESIQKISEARFDTTSIKEMLSMIDSLKGKTLIWFDTETSGLKFNRPLQFTQLAAVSTDSNGNTIDTFNEKIKLNPKTKRAYDKSNPEKSGSTRRALEINKYFDNITGEEREELDVLKDFIDWVLSHSNPVLIAYNISFDLEIINTISPTKLRFFTIDVMKIAQYFWIPLNQYLAKQGDEQSQLVISKLGRGRMASLPGSKLSVIASIFNLDTSNAHDALGDITMMKDVFFNMIDELKQYEDFNLPYNTRIDRISLDKRTKETEKKQVQKTNLRDRKFRKKYRKE